MSAAAAGAAASLARIESVSHTYGAIVALADVSLEVPRGCVVGLIGPDGVGKSTLLGLIAGVRKRQRGRLEVLGGDLASAAHRREICSRIGYMPQGLGGNLYADLSVLENADFFGRVFGLSRAEREARIGELLAATGLAAFRDRRERDLSGGMKQKLGLCCALVHDPELLILDEPTTGVDPLSRRQFWELIGGMRARRPGMSVLVATAYMEEAERFDRLALLDAGRVLASGSPEDLKARASVRSLDEAYIALLPADRRREHRPFELEPRAVSVADPAIEAIDLTRRFGAFTAVDRVSFRIERGEIFGFVGPNGCGKTTTMKMLAGLLPASEGSSKLLGRPVDPRDLESRRRIGYMSQAFSLYVELTVLQNLELHGRLFGLRGARLRERVAELMRDFELSASRDQLAAEVPLGLRQRLSLAVAVVHEPEILILDEPTSGVDPVARDRFWQLLADLSRRRGVTIFVSTHFMNEGARCDRIALMHAGRLLACDTPGALMRAQVADTLEQAFVSYVRAASPEPERAPARAGLSSPAARPANVRRGFDVQRLLAYAQRELVELRRDSIRLAMCFYAPLVLLIVLGYGISLDVDRVPWAVLDRDRTPESRELIDALAGSQYFTARKPLRTDREIAHRLQTGELRVAIEIPDGFGRDLAAGHRPEVGVWIDGAMPFRAEAARAYLLGVEEGWQRDIARRSGADSGEHSAAEIVPRFRYNQELRSLFSIVPGVLALVLMLMPTMLMAVAVVREKELGSITNFQATPVRPIEFLLGKQAPYVAVSFIAFLILTLATVVLFRVPLKGSFAALALGALLYVWAATGLGLLVSAFTRTQIAAIVVASVLTALPSIQLSGMIAPVSSLTGAAAAMSTAFPASWFNRISVGVFTKGLQAEDLVAPYAALIGFGCTFTLASLLLLRKQQP